MAGFGCVYCKLVYDDERALKAHVRFSHEGSEYKNEKRAMPDSMAEVLRKHFSDRPKQTAAEGVPMSEVKKHTKADSAWVVLHGNVYDLTEFLPDHPGGEGVVLEWAGKDATKFWSAIHKKAWIDEYVKPEWCLGPLGPEPEGGAADSSRLKEYEEEIAKLKAEILSLSAKPSRPSPGLKDAMKATEACKVPGPAPDKPPVVEEGPAPTALAGTKVVVVGHGPVGHDFVVKLVGMVGDGALEITVLGEELLQAYDRVHLTEYFEHRDAAKLSLVDGGQKWFTDHKVTLKTGAKAETIDRKKRVVTVKNPQTGAVEDLPYDACVLATGSYPFVPPLENLSTEVVGVFVYRTIEDLEGMITHARTSKKAGVIGGGLLGLEAAKAVYDLGQESHVFEMAPFLMPTQLDQPSGAVLQKKIEEMDIQVHTGSRLKSLVVENGVLKGILLTDSTHTEEYVCELDMLVVSAGIRPRDELARACGLAIGARGGVVVNGRMQSSDPSIYAIGEVASYKGMCYGLIAPGWDQATILAKNLEDATWGLKRKGGDKKEDAPIYDGSDLSTKLKLLGVDVASFGSTLDFWFQRQFDDAKANQMGLTSTVQTDPFSGLYRKLVFGADQKLMGGLLVGNADDYYSLLNLSKKNDLGGKAPFDLFLGGAGGDDAEALADDDIVCLCQQVTKKMIVDAVKEQNCATIPEVKRCTTAGSGCGGCILNTGFIPKIVKTALEECGLKPFVGISPCLPFTRAELFEIIRVKELKTYEEVVKECGRAGKIPNLKAAMAGDEVTKPVVASILASLWQQNPTSTGLQILQDTNDKYLANIQRSGQYSVIPRMPGGEVIPEHLILLGTVAKKYNLWTKITGAQRIGLFGANIWQLPDIWEDITYGRAECMDPESKVMAKLELGVGMESGHAYGKALRAIKSCVGTSWCRFGVQDSVSLAVKLEHRYKGYRAPHKFKMGVSGCMRECAEARGKDCGLVGTSAGYNLYVCGNHGTSPIHGTLLCTDISAEDATLYIDRMLVYYTFTAGPLVRTSKWLEGLEGGIDGLREVIIEDKLGLCSTFDERMKAQVDTYECEWKRVVDTPELRRKFRQFVNVEDKKYGDLEWEASRDQKKLVVEDLPTIIGKAKLDKSQADGTWRWLDVGAVEDYPQDGGGAVKVSKAELAVYNFSSLEKWYALQNSCPHKQLQVLSRGTLGMQGENPKVACPIHKNTYDLNTGKGISNPGLNVASFEAKAEGGRVLVHLPSDAVLDKALGREFPAGNCGGTCELPKNLEW